MKSLGFRPENIILACSSVAGHPAAALLRYLITAGVPDLPAPETLLMHPGTPQSTVNANDVSNLIGFKIEPTSVSRSAVAPANIADLNLMAEVPLASLNDVFRDFIVLSGHRPERIEAWCEVDTWLKLVYFA